MMIKTSGAVPLLLCSLTVGLFGCIEGDNTAFLTKVGLFIKS